MSDFSVALLGGIAILMAAIPYTTRIRHPRQKPLAAYLIFVTLFGATAAALAGLLAWLIGKLDLTGMLGTTGPAVVFLILVIVPSFALAAWQARKPPWRQQGPPD